MDRPTEEEVKKAVEVLEWFRNEIKKETTFHGCGYNPDFVLSVKCWLENIDLKYL